MEANQFDKYVGRKVLVTETKKVYSSKLSGDMEYTECEVSDKDTTLGEIQKETGYDNFRVWLPGTMGTMDARSDRLNVHVEKQDDGSYQVTRVNIG